ncbi:hypothetical protein HOT75_gp055 [Gordonia phage Daredevil]|uniref:Uncharacterized protein n=1 Tax=Gordonia phage Daredevil TaxID=2283286 RepID=A0A345MIR1_9CAUD|nr:hypothetical protein HOT75_gp055 [Gordonia phage Daredevil]AXH70442.1 hypothetical protein SEA_DAREDEVIL_55 [Gordonia phage Daredevil]
MTAASGVLAVALVAKTPRIQDPLIGRPVYDLVGAANTGELLSDMLSVILCALLLLHVVHSLGRPDLHLAVILCCVLVAGGMILSYIRSPYADSTQFPDGVQFKGFEGVWMNAYTILLGMLAIITGMCFGYASIVVRAQSFVEKHIIAVYLFGAGAAFAWGSQVVTLGFVFNNSVPAETFFNTLSITSVVFASSIIAGLAMTVALRETSGECPRRQRHLAEFP